MCLPRSIILNNNLLFDYLILGLFSYCDSPIPTIARPLLVTLRRISLRSVFLEDSVFLNSRFPNNIEYSVKYKYNK